VQRAAHQNHAKVNDMQKHNIHEIQSARGNNMLIQQTFGAERGMADNPPNVLGQ
jgi:hypothetical protein